MKKIISFTFLLTLLMGQTLFAASNILRNDAYNCELIESGEVLEDVEFRFDEKNSDKNVLEVIHDRSYIEFNNGSLFGYINDCNDDFCTLTIVDENLMINNYELANPQTQEIDLIINGYGDLKLTCIDHGRDAAKRELLRLSNQVEANAKGLKRSVEGSVDRLKHQTEANINGAKRAGKKAEREVKKFFDKF